TAGRHDIQPSLEIFRRVEDTAAPPTCVLRRDVAKVDGPTESATASTPAFHYTQNQTSIPGRRRRRCPRPLRYQATVDPALTTRRRCRNRNHTSPACNR